MFLKVVGHVRTCSDAFGCNRMHFGALGRIRALPEIFVFFGFFRTIFGRFWTLGAYYWEVGGLLLWGANYWEAALFESSVDVEFGN